MQDKKTLRRAVLAARARDHNQFVDRNIAHRLMLTDAYRGAKTIFIYVSFGSEIDTHAIITRALADGKRVAVPLCKDGAMHACLTTRFPDDLAPGTMGILEPTHPKPVAAVDLVIVPGVAFTKSGKRLGYGGGYYDRYFAALKNPVPTIALVAEAQILPDLPTDAHDVPVDMLISERGAYCCKDYI